MTDITSDWWSVRIRPYLAEGMTPEEAVKAFLAMKSEAGKRAARTNIEKYGADYYSHLGKFGGQQSRGYEFAHGKVDPSEAGKKGGASPRIRRKRNADTTTK